MGYAVTKQQSFFEVLKVKVNREQVHATQLAYTRADTSPLRDCTATCGLGCAGDASACLAPEVHQKHPEKLPMGERCS